jgi:hypothetical protein
MGEIGRTGWAVTFLITGFTVPKPHRLGLIEFSPPVPRSSPTLPALIESARLARFPLRVDVFPCATIVMPDDDRRTAIRWALFELDRTLDTLTFTDFGCSKYLPVGVVVDLANPSVALPLDYSETYIPGPIVTRIALPPLEGYRLDAASCFHAHSAHLLNRRNQPLSESEDALAGALRWCRLGALARTFSESSTVAFVLEWTALETLVLGHGSERVNDALERIPKLMRHWPTDVDSNYMPTLRADDPQRAEAEWHRLVFDELYPHRKDVFHGREFHVPNDPNGPALSHRALGLLEAILGRVVAFVGKRSRTEQTIQLAWKGVGVYATVDDDCPPRNLGGWTRWGPS